MVEVFELIGIWAFRGVAIEEVEVVHANDDVDDVIVDGNEKIMSCREVLLFNTEKNARGKQR